MLVASLDGALSALSGVTPVLLGTLFCLLVFVFCGQNVCQIAHDSQGVRTFRAAQPLAQLEGPLLQFFDLFEFALAGEDVSKIIMLEIVSCARFLDFAHPLLVLVDRAPQLQQSDLADLVHHPNYSWSSAYQRPPCKFIHAPVKWKLGSVFEGAIQWVKLSTASGYTFCHQKLIAALNIGGQSCLCSY